MTARPTTEPQAQSPAPRPGRRPGSLRSVTRRRVVLTALVVLGAVAVSILVTSPIGTAPGRAPATAGAGFYLLEEPGTGLQVGQRPPLLRSDDGTWIVDLAGTTVDLTTYVGRPVWVVFWATWCPPCQQETPDLERAYRANIASGLELVAVNVQESADVARSYATTYGLTYRIALDPAAGVFRRWNVFGLPTHYFIGRDGLIRDRWFGPLSLQAMQSRIDAIANLAPPSSRGTSR